jgi:hypothetical protein
LTLFAVTVFVSAALMFLVEPMVGRMVLPLAGGGPMVWNTCVVFFQAALLAGYAYARWLTARASRRRLIVHALVVAAPLAALPPSISGAPAPGANPAPWLLVALAAAVGLPFFVLATTASLFQKWFAETPSRWAKNPYLLYAFSNLGSVLALVAYPIVVEPALALRAQVRWWTVGYAVFGALALISMAVVWRHSPHADPARRSEEAPVHHASWRQRGKWTLLAFVPSSLMLGVTSYLATDVASIPLLWVVPLALYLVTFVVAFSTWGERAREHAAVALPLVVLPLVVLLISRLVVPLSTAIVLHLAVFTAVGLSCHGELAAARPDTPLLPDFYLWVAVGGVAGGLFNSLIAPLVFSSITEYPIALAIGCALSRPTRSRLRERIAAFDGAVALGFGLLTVAAWLWLVPGSTSPRPLLAALGVVAFASFTQSRRSLRFGLCVGAMLGAGLLVQAGGSESLHRERTFFGVYRVETTNGGRYHALYHGTTLHGAQAVDPARRLEPLTYYVPTGPLGVALSTLPQMTATARVAVVGLGAGALAAWARADQQWTFYEIDPAVERIARSPEYFTFLSSCGARCGVVIGDARQSLALSGDPSYDLIILDAFSSDTIPLHLLSREALQLYLRRLKRRGALALHISNRHLELSPVLARLAASEHLEAREWFDTATNVSPEIKLPSHWVLMTRCVPDLGAISGDSRWTVPKPRPSTPLWTDDFSNVWSVLR